MSHSLLSPMISGEPTNSGCCTQILSDNLMRHAKSKRMTLPSHGLRRCRLVESITRDDELWQKCELKFRVRVGTFYYDR